MFVDLFASGHGRPSVPAGLVATVIVLQTLHGLSHREAAEAVMFDLRGKAACGPPRSNLRRLLRLGLQHGPGGWVLPPA